MAVPDFIVVDGLAVGVSAAAPATQDIAGYGALTYTDAVGCEIVEWTGWKKTWETQRPNTLCVEGVPESKTKRIFEDATLTLNYVKASSAFYGIIKTAEASATDKVAVRMTYPDGLDFIYCQALVKRADDVGGQSGDYFTVEIIFMQQVEQVTDIQ